MAKGEMGKVKGERFFNGVAQFEDDSCGEWG
jgi:hypothetical protein